MESKLKFAQMDQAGESPTVAKPAAQKVVPLDDYPLIAHLIGVVFMAGDFKAETATERQLEALLIKTGHRYADWAEVDAINERTFAAPVAAVPAVPSERDLEQRAIGRSEAAAIVLGMDPEADLFEGCFGSCALADTGDYSTHWLEDKVHEVFRAADTTWSMLSKAEAEYYEREGLLADTRVMHAEARQLRGLDWNSRNDIETAAKAVAESDSGLSKRLYATAHAAQNSAHEAYCATPAKTSVPPDQLARAFTIATAGPQAASAENIPQAAPGEVQDTKTNNEGVK